MKNLLGQALGYAFWTPVVLIYMGWWSPAGLSFDGFFNTQRVDAIYYPTGDSVGGSIHNDNIGSLEACRSWARGRIEDNGHGSYGCGINPDASGVYEDIIR